MTPGTREWVFRALRDWTLEVSHGMALVTYRSTEARDAVIAHLHGELVGKDRTSAVLRCTASSDPREFIAHIRANPAYALSVIDPDRLLFGDNEDHAPFWINFNREAITGHPGVQIWWVSPKGAVRIGAIIPDLGRFFLFREELTEETVVVERSSPVIYQSSAAPAFGSEDRAEDLLQRAMKAARSPHSNPARVWFELGLPAVREWLDLRETSRAIDAFETLVDLIGPPAAALQRTTELAASNELADEARIASGLLTLSWTDSELGRKEESFESAKEAVRIYRDLARNAPEEFLPDLAKSLNTLGISLNDLGRREEALEATEEAVRIRRDLAAKRPDLFLPDLAVSLNNLGIRLRDLGRQEAALEPTEEAVRIRRDLAAPRPDLFLPGLANSLNNLGVSLTDLGRQEEALALDEEAVRIRRELAEKRPDLFLPDLAQSLNNLGVSLADLGRREEALALDEEAVRIRRGLASQRPHVFLPDLATSLNNLGISLRDLGRLEEALELTEEAVRIRRDLAAKRPDVFLPGLAMSLSNLGIRLSDLGRREEALEPTEEAVRVYRNLAGKRPDVFLPNLAISLSNLGISLHDLNRPEAREPMAEAVQIYRDLSLKRPDIFSPDLARSLSVLAEIELADRPIEAALALDEAIRSLTPCLIKAVKIHRPLMETLIEHYRHAVEAAGREPADELLAPVRAVLETGGPPSAQPQVK